jgi:hypothetical protein
MVPEPCTFLQEPRQAMRSKGCVLFVCWVISGWYPKAVGVATQERDGFSAQIVTLRDKASQLARELAEREESAKDQKCRLVQLEQTIDELQRAACNAQRAWKHERILLAQVCY